MKALLPLLFVLFALCASCQVNLVTNPGFEDISFCPTTLDGIYLNAVDNWFTPTDAAPDYFSTCAPQTAPANAPSNFFGNRIPHGGNAYAGIFTYADWTNVSSSSATDYVEYIQTRLMQRLEKDVTYCVSFYVSNAYNHSHAFQTYTTDAIGAAFTNDRVFANGNNISQNWKLNLPQAITNPVGNFIHPEDGWVKVSGLYKANGTELFLTIGNFTAPFATPFLQISPPYPTLSPAAYFFIDDVSVVKTDYMKNDTVVCAHQLATMVLVPDSNATGYLWNTGETTPTIMPGDTGWFWVQYNDACALERDSVHISTMDAPQTQLPGDTTICQGTNITLATTNSKGAVTAYEWSTGAKTPTINMGSATTIWVRAANRCGVGTDTMVISITDKPKVELPASVDLCEDTVMVPLTISANTGLDNYLWNTGVTTNTITITQPGQYWLSSQNMCGTSIQYVNATGCPPPPLLFASIYIPNAFSPNGDGNNDVWMTYGDSIKINSIAVFNRWGEKVFETDTNSGWDGIYKGILQPPGVYVYYIRCSDLLTTKPRHYKGSLTLLR